MLQCGAGQLALGLAHLAVHSRSAGLNVSSNPLCGLTSVYQIPRLVHSCFFFFGNDMARMLSCPPTAMAVHGVKYQNWFPIAAGGSKHAFDYKAFAANIEQNPPTCLWGECRCDEMSRRYRVALWFHVCRETNPAASPECRERERCSRKWTVGGTAAAELPRDHA